MTPLRKLAVVLLSFALLLGASLAVARPVAATQNAPSLSTGDQWTYGVSSRGGGNSTVVFTIQEQTTLATGSGVYAVWHVKETSIAPFGGSTITSYSDVWIATDGARIAKLVTTGVLFFGNTTVTYDPPIPQAVFPLNAGDSWSVPSQTHTQNNLVNLTTTSSYSGIVTGEQSVTVPAGTFTAAIVRSPSTGNPYTLSYYSEQAGWFVQVRSYNGQGVLTSTQNLTAYKYSGYGILGIPYVVWFILLVVVLALAVTAAILLRRRRPRAPYAMPPQGSQAYPPPYQPPVQPPPQGPPPQP